MLSLLSLALLINSVTQTNALVSNNSTFQHRLALTPDGMSITFDSYSNEFTSKVRLVLLLNIAIIGLLFHTFSEGMAYTQMNFQTP